MDDAPWPRTLFDRLLSRATDSVQRHRGVCGLMFFAWYLFCSFVAGRSFSGWPYLLLWLPANTVASFMFGSIVACWITKADRVKSWDE